jgi:hypothetical protein
MRGKHKPIDMFTLTVVQNSAIVQTREYHSAIECGSKIFAAYNYYREKGQESEIRMLDSRMMLIYNIFTFEEWPTEPINETL